ncbi:MAG TPA: metallophosphoesterase, partial [Longimicrobium sp.]|nr:metallophosphoesterase [Longimicrobium sp.]
MDRDLAAVYRHFGFDVPPQAPAAGPLAAAAAVDGGGPAGEEEKLPTVEDIDRMLERLDDDPRGVLREARAMWDAELTEWRLRSALQEARDALTAPRTFAVAAAAAEDHAIANLPPGFTFPGMLPPIEIIPGQSKFEPHADAAGWALSFISSKLNRPGKPNFRNHASFVSRFHYPLKNPTANAPVEIALFSDFGTGLYYSQYIARQIQRKSPDLAFHLGDVYYAGQPKEFEKHFAPFVEPLLQRAPLYLLVANHEMMADGRPYIDYLDDKRARFPATQPQEGTYFRVVGSKFQVVGVDTDWNGKDRMTDDQAAWLEDVLRDGRAGRLPGDGGPLPVRHEAAPGRGRSGL